MELANYVFLNCKTVTEEKTSIAKCNKNFKRQLLRE